MTGPVLVTGGTGTLGSAVVARLGERARDHRVFSRTPGPGRIVGDLTTGDGLDEAVRDVRAILHLATAPGSDADSARRLIAAAKRCGAPHVVYISIVGIDRIPLGYYREKLAVEHLLEDSGLPWTVLRATQFHDLLDALFAALARTGLLPVLAGTRFQPIDVRDVAERLVDLAAEEPAGRVADIGGPQVRGMDELARTWLRANVRRRPVLPVRVPGRLARAFRDGENLCPQHAEGRHTFEEFVGARTPSGRS